ncbi:amidohydrolase family protein [soil metagenome]
MAIQPDDGTVHDLVIRGGDVVDGTGAPSRVADVAISGGTITEVGPVPDAGAVEIDAAGLLVTPGFVDIHAHYDGQATWSGRLDPSSWHGVTTLVAGNCGVGFAPVRPADHDTLIELMEGVEDIPGVALQEGLAWDWQSFPEFLDVLDRGSFDADLGVQVPHGPLRLHVMGQRGADREPATPDDIARMAEIAAEAVAAGAIGFSTSRTLNHRTSKGEPVPSLTAEADELVGIAKAIGETGQGVLQVVSDFADADAEFALCRRMVEESGRPLSFSLLQSRGDSYRYLLDLLAQANADGLPITAQVAPRAVGLLFGLECTLNPFMANPVYGEIAALPFEERVAELRDPSFRTRLLAAAERDTSDSPTPGAHLITALQRMYPLGDPPDYEPEASTSVLARAQASGGDGFALALDTMLADDGHGFLYLPLLNYCDGNLDAAGEMLAHPNTVVGLGDGGAHVGTICDASFPTTLLTHWGRDRAHGQMDLPFLVHRQTQATARTVGFLDRGVLAPGMRADVNVIDHAALSARRPTIRHDLPAGGRRLVQTADGYVATVVAGQVTYRSGVASEALPGRLIRGPQPAPSGVGAAAAEAVR